MESKPILKSGTTLQIPEGKEIVERQGSTETGLNEKVGGSITLKTQGTRRGSGDGTNSSSRWKSTAASSTNSADFDGERESVRKKRPASHVLVRVCVKLCNSITFSTVSVILTIWALIADDIRLGFTTTRMDMFFNVMALLCLCFFTIEIFISSLGKPDYFLGFFFYLDVISTGSLILDLTWVSDAIQNNNTGGKEARGGRTAKIGASVGRMVRVLRLVRIVKLYKAYFDRTQRQNNGMKKGEEYDPLEPGEEPAFLEDDPDVPKEAPMRESLVGQKLTSLTIRKVIIMVLVMLLVLPQLSTDKFEKTPRSPYWGADNVWRAFRLMRAENDRVDELKKIQQIDNYANATSTFDKYRASYAEELLRYIYYHNWFDRTDCVDFPCANLYSSHVFWFGIAGRNEETVRAAAELAQLKETDVKDWETNIREVDYYYGFVGMPAEIISRMSQPWETKCKWTSEWGEMSMFGVSLLAEEIDGWVDNTVDCPAQPYADLRNSESLAYWPTLISDQDLGDQHFVAFFDMRAYQRSSVESNMLITTFICFVLCVGSLVFSRDANVLVLNPLEQMMHKVNTIRDNPLIAMKMADLEYQQEEHEKMKQRQKRKAADSIRSGVQSCREMCKASNAQKKDVMETAILEKTIIKLGSLLALGFGEAGASIVSSNMRSALAGVNAMFPGERVDCFIGTAKVRDFSSVTQVLQGKVLTFVNQLAEIVHGVVDQFHGAANKNNGDTFLLIWRSQQTKYNDKITEETRITKLADMAITTFVTILSAVHRSRLLARYREHPGLQQRLGSDCRVNLSFGLHFGWAIEGAVGSEFKIDASYLSPTVSVAESVERATKIYGVNIIITKAVISRCSKVLSLNCRLIDNVWIKGSKEAIELYTVDLDHHALEVDEKRIIKGGWNVRQRFKARQMLEIEKRRKWADDYDVAGLFELEDVEIMREIYTEEFLQIFNMGYQNYAEGEWQVAKRLLEKTLSRIRPGTSDTLEDGPSRALLTFMEKDYQFQAPIGWEGVRTLDDESTAATS